jgi:hypothetical protein
MYHMTFERLEEDINEILTELQQQRCSVHEVRVQGYPPEVYATILYREREPFSE